MKRLRREAGVTLMELMIAVSLVSFLSLGMLMAIRVGLSAMEKTNNRFLANRKVMSVQQILESQVGGVMPVLANCGSRGGAQFVFFSGKPSTMRFVSTYSLEEASRGYPRVLAFEVVRGPLGMRLIVNEAVYPGPIGAGLQCTSLNAGVPVFNDTGANPRSFVLADKLAFCRLMYRETLPAPELERWLPEWTVPDRMPSGIRIEMAPIDSEPARLQIQTLTIPVRITKWVLGPYADN